MFKKRLALTCMLFLACLSHASAQTYPSKPIKIVIPFTPGGTSDIYGRMLAQNLSEILKQNVLIDNKPGASTMIGAEAVARAPNDGYSLLFTVATTLTSVPFLFTKVSYKSEDFEPITMVATNPYALVVAKSFSAQTINEVIAQAKANPQKVRFGSTGFGGGGSLAGKALERAAGIEMIEVPYKGTAEVAIELAAGRIDLYADGLPGALEMQRNGTARVLAVLDSKRSPSAPDVPAITELGYPDLVILNWYAMFAPAGTSKEIIEQLNVAIAKASSDQKFKDRLTSDGMVVETSRPEQVGEMIRKESINRKQLIDAAGIKPQ